MKTRRLALLLVALISIGLAWLFFSPTPIEGTPLGSFVANSLASFFDPSGKHHGSTIRALEQWMNFVVFIPFSLLLFFSIKRGATFWSLGISIFLSFVAETAQLLVLPERVSSPEDFLLNTAGAMVGVGVANLISRRHKLRQQ